MISIKGAKVKVMKPFVSIRVCVCVMKSDSLATHFKRTLGGPEIK